MLTEDMLNANDATKDLAPEAKKAIIQLSADDEKKVIGEHRGEWWRTLDKDIKEITGEGKPDGLKSYQFLKDTLTSLKGSAEKAAGIDKLTSEITELKKEKAKLEKTIADGITDAEAVKKINTLEQQIADKDGEISQLKTNSETKIKELETSLAAERKATMDNTLLRMIDEHLVEQKIQWLDTIPEDFLNETLKGKKASILDQMRPDRITNSDGSTSIVLRDEDNNIIYDKETSKPLSPGQFFIKEGNLSSIIASERIQEGGGGEGAGRRKPGSGSARGIIKGARTQVEATTMVEKYLMQKEGLSKLDSAYSDRFYEISEELKISDLPMTENAILQ